MCNLNKKLVLFDYTVERFVEWDREVTNRRDESENEILKSFNFTRYMKLLYFTCIESVQTEDNKEIGLFQVFKNFWAYENGPVEVDVYSNRSSLFKYTFNGDFLEKREDIDIDNSKLYIPEKKQINKAISNLKKRKNFYMNNTLFMIELSHNLKLWKDSVFLYPPIMDTSVNVLKKEKELFEKKLVNSENIYFD